MKKIFPDGVWPVMLTPFDKKGEVDYAAMERLIQWYEKNGVSGIFAVCQSSEMFQLSISERIQIAKFVKKTAKVPVIASGHISYSPQEQREELRAIAQTGVDAVILISCLLAKEDEDDEILLNRLKNITKDLPREIPLGIYECPYPYKRILSDKVISWCAASGRYYFIKDTCCDIKRIKRRLELIQGSVLKLYNANTATLLESIQFGAAGYSGVMANFHPMLYDWIIKNHQKQPEVAKELSALLTMCSYIEMKNYPQNAKYALKEMGVDMELMTRKVNGNLMNPTLKDEIRQLNTLSEIWEKRICD